MLVPPTRDDIENKTDISVLICNVKLHYGNNCSKEGNEDVSTLEPSSQCTITCNDDSSGHSSVQLGFHSQLQQQGITLVESCFN